jgi:Uma2 family endonuclease
MVSTTTKLMSAEEFFEWTHRPENAGKHHELERGEVVEMSRPGERHGYVCGNIARILGNYTFQRRKGYVLSNDPGILWERDPDTVRDPDVVLYDQPRRYRDLSPKYSDEVPTLAVEVVSPNDRLGKVNRRTAQYLRWGVAVVWVADPEDCTLTVHRKGGPLEVFEIGHELLGGDALPGFRCRVEEFFFLPGEEPAPAPPPVAP